MKKRLCLMLVTAVLGTATLTAAQETTFRMRVQSGYIGIRFDEERIINNGNSSSRVVIGGVSKGSPADNAGLRVGDEILRINGLNAGNGKFAAVARTLSPGDTVRLRIKRDGAERDYTVVAAPRSNAFAGPDRTIIISADSVRELSKRWLDSARFHLDSLRLPRVFITPGDSAVDIRIERFVPRDTLIFKRDTASVRRFRGGPPREFFRHFEEGAAPIIRSFELGNRSVAGAELTDFDPAMKSLLGTDRGLLVLRVAPETPAARAGLQPGDVVVKANDRAVASIADLRNLMWARPETLRLEIVRKGETRTLEVPLQRRGNEE